MDSCDLRLEGDLLLGGRLLRQGVVLVCGERIHWCGPSSRAPDLEPRRTLRCAGGMVTPGFVDLHVHGAGGFDVADGSAEALDAVCRTHARHGTTALCPTLLCGSPQATLRALDRIRQAAGATQARPGRARVLGAHLEGPFLNPRRAGAQPAEHLRAPDMGLLEELLAAAGASLRVLTLAPELPGALRLVERLREHGVVVAMGHSDATFDQAKRAIDAGCRLAAHTFNAMRGLHHREAGLLGAVLLDRRVTAEVIADGHHVSAPALQLLWRLKGHGRTALITDCTAALEAPPGQARLGRRPVLVQDGAVRLPDGTLAGSALSMERAVVNIRRLARLTRAAAARAASLTPASLLGLEHGIAAGGLADLLLLGQHGACEAVVIGGCV